MSILKLSKLFRIFQSDSLFFVFCHYLSFVFNSLSGIVIRRFLGPWTMGLFSELMLILQYGKFHHLGVINAMERDIPYYRGAASEFKVTLIQKSALAFILITTLHVAVILGVVIFFWKNLQSTLPFIILLIFIETLIAYYQTILQSYRQFKEWGKVTAFISSIDFVLKWVLTYLMGIYGLLFAMVISGLLTILLYFQWSSLPLPHSPIFSWKEMKELLKPGLSIIFFRTMYLFSQSIDRIIILYFLGQFYLGLYSIPTMVSSILTTFPKSKFRMLTPDIIQIFGKTKNIDSVKSYLYFPYQNFKIYFSFLIGLVILAMPFGVHWIFPQFKEAIWPAQLIAAATYFGSFIYSSNMLLLAFNEQKKLAALYGGSAVLVTGMVLFFVLILKKGLIGAAYGVLLSQIIFTTVFISYVYQYYTKSIIEHLKLFITLYYPALWIILALLWSLKSYSPSMSLSKDILYGAEIMGIFLLCCIPLFLVSRQFNFSFKKY